MTYSQVLALASFAALAAPSAFADEFTLDDLQAIVAEFDTVVPHNPLYTYPVEVSIVEDEDVNAYAGIRIEGESLQATLVANTGFIEAVEADPAMMRAVVAHEMAHLALGHAVENSDWADLDQFLTRQEEFAADAAGAAYLEALGFERSEMVELLEFLDTNMQQDSPSWLGVVGSDHASPVTRAALVDGDSSVHAALSRLEVGVAFMECRRYEEAILWFRAALEIEPRMHEAQVNIALASLQDYYERLPIKVQAEWLRPAFTAHLTTSSLLGGRAVEITDKDLVRYQRVVDAVAEFPKGRFEEIEIFILGTLEVLHPSGDQATIEAGVERLRASELPFLSHMPREVQENQLRLASNIAVGLHRLGRTAEAQEALVSRSLEAAEVFVRAAAENIGRLPFAGLNAEEARQALNITASYVMNTPPNAPNFEVVRSTMQNLLKSLGLELSSEIEPQDLYLCQAVAMTIDGKELLLFDPLERFSEALGEASDAGFLLDKYPDLGCAMWGEQDVVLLTERGSVLKITSYKPGSSVDLKPINSSSRETHRVSVGMGEAELDALLSATGVQSASTTTLLFGRSVFREDAAPENWRYYPALNFGVLLEGGEVIAVSVTPV